MISVPKSIMPSPAGQPQAGVSFGPTETLCSDSAAVLQHGLGCSYLQHFFWENEIKWVLPWCLMSFNGLEGTHVQGAQYPGVVVKCRSPAASHCFSPFSRFVQLLESVLCYLIPLSEDSIGTFNALRVSKCQASLGWC